MEIGRFLFSAGLRPIIRLRHEWLNHAEDVVCLQRIFHHVAVTRLEDVQWQHRSWQNQNSGQRKNRQYFRDRHIWDFHFHRIRLGVYLFIGYGAIPVKADDNMAARAARVDDPEQIGSCNAVLGYSSLLKVYAAAYRNIMVEFAPMDISTAKEFLARHHWGVLTTRRKEGSLQMSPVTVGIDAAGTCHHQQPRDRL